MDLNELNDDQLAGLYHKLKERREAMEEALKNDPKYVRYGDAIKEVETILTNRLEAGGATSIKTPNGTIHTTTRTTARIMDSEAFRGHVISTQDWGMLDWKANMTVCRDYMKTYDEPVPGVELSTYRQLRVTSPIKSLRRVEE